MPNDQFERDGYLLLPDMLARPECERLTRHLFHLHEAGRMQSDPQCPRSRAIYGDAELDRLLLQLRDPLATHLGRDLLTTYSYARIYFPGETLVRHVDRAACEISATLTLGFDAERVWPIYFARDRYDFLGKKVDIDVGALAIYKGCDMPHWRRAFEGKWQAQVFLHYVDANGPHAAEALDRRQALGTPANPGKGQHR